MIKFLENTLEYYHSIYNHFDMVYYTIICDLSIKWQNEYKEFHEKPIFFVYIHLRIFNFPITYLIIEWDVIGYHNSILIMKSANI